MKILLDSHLLGQKKTGLERYWKNLIYYSRESVPHKKLYLYTNLPKKNLPVYTRKMSVYSPQYENGFYRIFFGFNLAEKKIKPDIIHVQNFTPFVKTAPIVNTVHDLCFKISPHTFSFKSHLAFRFFFRRSLALSDAIICSSVFTKKTLSRFYNIDPEKLFVIYPAADPIFKFVPDKVIVKNTLRKKFSIYDDYFLVVGDVDYRKQPLRIIRAFKKSINEYPKTLLVFVGPNKIKLKETNNIRVLNYVNDKDLNLLYNGSTALIYFSVCEGFGFPIIEAMTTKTPVICSNIPVFKEISQSAAIYIKNEDNLTWAINKIIKNKSLRNKYSSLGYERSKIFSWEKTIKQTVGVYNWILDKRISNFNIQAP